MTLMRLILFVIFSAASPILASDDSPDLAALLWQARPVVIFADSEADPRFVQQVRILESAKIALDDRDVIVLTDTDPQTLSALRKKLRPRGFMFVLIDKDGQIKYRKPNPVPADELIRFIDRMPSRKQEISNKTGILDK